MNDSAKQHQSKTDDNKVIAASSDSESTKPPAHLSFNVSVTGLDKERGTELAHYIGGIAKDLSGTLDLGCLEGITITDAYEGALENFDPGYEPSKPLAPTNESFGSGHAMVVHCKRGDELKCHVFFDVDLAANALFAEDECTRKSSTASIVHELAHVHDFGTLCRSMPNVIFSPVPKDLEGWLYRATDATWSEYFACWIAAKCGGAALDCYVEIFLKALEELPEAVRMEIVSYRTHSDLQSLMDTVNDRIGLLFKFAGYVIGHLEGINQTLEETHPSAWEAVLETGFEPTYNGLKKALEEMREAYPNWNGLDAYKGLGDVMLSYLETQQIYIYPEDGDSFHVNIPFTPETMPSAVS